jgi:hypothetical protein
MIELLKRILLWTIFCIIAGVILFITVVSSIIIILYNTLIRYNKRRIVLIQTEIRD